MQKLHGMGSQPQVVRRGMGLLPQPALLHRVPKAFSAKQPSGEGWTGSIRHVSKGVTMPWLTQLLLLPAWLKPPKVPAQQEPCLAPRMQPCPMLCTPTHNAQLQIFPRKLKRLLTVHLPTTLLFLWTLSEKQVKLLRNCFKNRLFHG